MKLKATVKTLLDRVGLRSSAPVYSDYFNVPLKFTRSEWYANERIVEVPFVHRMVGRHFPVPRGNVLELGPTRSDVCLALASQGFAVKAIDLRNYRFDHPRLAVEKCDLEDFVTPLRFDIVYSVSAVEHIGLGVYGEARDDAKLGRAVTKLAGLLAQEGILLLTLPFGKWHCDEFLRSFDTDHFDALVVSAGLKVCHAEYYRRLSFKYYVPCSSQEIREIDNGPLARGSTGVNGVGCFVLRRADAANS